MTHSRILPSPPSHEPTAAGRHGHRRLGRSISLCIGLGLSLSLLGCDKPKPSAQAPMPTVNGAVISFPGQRDPEGLRTAPVAAAADQPLMVPGRLSWDEDATARLFPPMAGRLERVQAQLGQTVAQGAVLAQLSAAEYGQAQAEAQRAQADERLALRQLERARSLLEVGAVAGKEVQAAQAEHERAQAELQRSRARLAPYAGTAASAVGGTVHQTLAIISPVSGVVVERNVNPGLEVRPDAGGPALFVVSDPSRLWAVLDLDETQLARVQTGTTLQLRTAAWPDERFEATVDHVGRLVDPASRTIKVRARIPNRHGKLRAEMFVQAQLETVDGRARVPADAVFVRGDQLGVFVVLGEGRYERRFPKLRAAGPQWWLVEDGLAVGDQVVVGAALFLNQMLDAAR